MKKIAITIVLLFSVGLCANAQNGGLFGYGMANYETASAESDRNPEPILVMPQGHGLQTDQFAPLGSGMLLLLGFGAAYALKKRKVE